MNHWKPANDRSTNGTQFEETWQQGKTGDVWLLPVLNDTFISMQLFCDAFLLLRPLAPIHFLMNRLVRSVGIFGPFELHFESLHANLEAIHGLNSSLSTGRVVETHKTCRQIALHVTQTH